MFSHPFLLPGLRCTHRLSPGPLRLHRRDCDRPDPLPDLQSNQTVTSTSTGLSRQTSTDEAGYYSIPNLPLGAYDVFRDRTRLQRWVRYRKSVTVEASAALLQTTKTDVNVNLEARAIGNLPLSGYRNFQSLINLVPGATPGRYQNAVVDTPQRDLSFNFKAGIAATITLLREDHRHAVRCRCNRPVAEFRFGLRLGFWGGGGGERVSRLRAGGGC